jgi:hyaluronoglucosaminidase
VTGRILGVIEGFYGPPWSWKQRDRMVDFLAAHGYNLYVHAPKDDAMHRTSWRDAYLPEELRIFGRLARRCAAQGIEFVYGISPIDIASHNEGDFQTLLEKAHQVHALGIRSFCLLFDDMPGGLPDDAVAGARVAEYQAGLANRLLRHLAAEGETRLIFTPTEYCGAGDSPYLRALGEELSAEIEVFWTGPQVCSHTISGAELRAVTASLRRRPLLWDNYPVNDGEMRYDPHIRPYQGRSADLPAAVAGIVANPAIEAEASKIALHTIASYWANPTTYDAERAWTAALEELSETPGGGEALRILGNLTRRSPIEPGAHRRQLPAFATFWERWQNGGLRSRRAAIVQLHREIDRLAAAGELIRDDLRNRPLRRDLEPWSRKLLTWCAALREAVEVLAVALDTPAPGAIEVQRAKALGRLIAARRDFYRVAERPFEAFVRDCLWEAAALAEGRGAAARAIGVFSEVAP